MLNFGFWSSLKGMVKVPNLSGLTKPQAITSIQDSHLNAVETGSTSTSDPALDQKIASQDPSADTVVNYDTDVSYIFYNFAFTPYSFTPSFSFTPYSFTPYSFTPYSFTPYSFTPYSFVPATTYYCSMTYYDTNLPNEQYESPTDDTGVTCGLYSIVCGPTPWPAYPARPPACPPAYSFTPYSFTPYSFTPYSFTPYSFTPFSFTPYSFTPYSFTPASTSGVVCSSFDVANDMCSSVGCDLGGCGSGGVCSGSVNRC